MLFFIILRSGC